MCKTETEEKCKNEDSLAANKIAEFELRNHVKNENSKKSSVFSEKKLTFSSANFVVFSFLMGK